MWILLIDGTFMLDGTGDILTSLVFAQKVKFWFATSLLLAFVFLSAMVVLSSQLRHTAHHTNMSLYFHFTCIVCHRIAPHVSVCRYVPPHPQSYARRIQPQLSKNLPAFPTNTRQLNVQSCKIPCLPPPPILDSSRSSCPRIFPPPDRSRFRPQTQLGCFHTGRYCHLGLTMGLIVS